MSKNLFSLFLACLLSSLAAEESSDQVINSAVRDLDTILRSDILGHEKDEATKQFFEKLEGLGEEAELDLLIKEGQKHNYFNIAFGQIPEHPESRLSERLFRKALDINDYFALEPWSGNPQNRLAHEYLRNRLNLNLNEDARSGLYGAFFDSEFLGALSQEFDAIIAAETEDEKSVAERKAAMFLENYAYRPVREVLEEKFEKQIRQKERIKPEGKPEFSTSEPRMEKRDRFSRTDIVNKDGEYRVTSQFEMYLWVASGLVVVLVAIFILRIKLKSY